MRIPALISQSVLAAAVVGGAVLGPVAPALALTIGYVDTAKVLFSYSGARNAQGQMQQELVNYQKAFAERQKKIAAAQKEGKKPEEIQKMTEDFEKELAPLKTKAMNLEAKLSGTVKTKVEAIIKNVAKARRLDLVLDKAVVLHGGIDITNDVIKALK